MKTRLFATAALIAASALASCGAGATYPSFSETEYRVEGSAAAADGAMQRMVIYRDGPKMRVETMTADGRPAVVVFDEAAGHAFVLDAAAQTAVTAAADAPEPLEAPWAALGADNAERVASCTVAGEDGNEWRAKDQPDGNIACITGDGIVLKVRDADRVIFEASAVERGTQEATLFAVPAGYQVVDQEAVMAEVDETMEQLDSVASDDAAATPTPSAPQHQ